MGFNRCYVSNILQIHKELDDLGLQKFAERYRKYDAITGDSESISFIINLVSKYYGENDDKKSVEEKLG
jgi:ribonucleotide reductase alpha subunit